MVIKKLIVAFMALGSITAYSEEGPIILDMTEAYATTPAHVEYLKKFSTWHALHGLCATKPPSNEQLSIGLHLIYSVDINKALKKEDLLLTDPHYLSLVEGRKFFIEDRALAMANQVGLERPKTCEQYEDIEKEATSFFRVKGVLSTAMASAKNLKNQ